MFFASFEINCDTKIAKGETLEQLDKAIEDIEEAYDQGAIGIEYFEGRGIEVHKTVTLAYAVKYKLEDLD